MDYPGFLAEQWPIGSGVTAAACKHLVKQRLCASGMRWKTTGAKVVLSLRALTHAVGSAKRNWTLCAGMSGYGARQPFVLNRGTVPRAPNPTSHSEVKLLLSIVFSARIRTPLQ